MSRSKGTANLAASLEVLAGAPLDAREKVPTKADLYIAANFPYPYVGLETYVVAENKKYRLVGNDVTVEANWEEIGSGGGGGTTVVANPEGEATDELEKLQVGNDIYSIPEENVEINKAQFDALPAATKNNGKAYFIPDANILTNFTVMGNRFDKANIYDTTERMVGRWIDGKPLYQKVMYSSTSTGSGTVAHGIENVDTIFVSEFFLRSAASPSKVRTYALSQISTGNAVVKVDETNLTMQFATSGWTSDQGYMAVLKYTKTTDASVVIGTENDYSTEEMIIGTWIDGKPLYQKTLDCGALPNNATKSVAHGISDLAYVVSCEGFTLNPTSNAQLPIPFISTGSSKGIGVAVSATNVELSTDYDRRSYTYTYVTIQYTKTTD